MDGKPAAGRARSRCDLSPSSSAQRAPLSNADGARSCSDSGALSELGIKLWLHVIRTFTCFIACATRGLAHFPFSHVQPPRVRDRRVVHDARCQVNEVSE